jgi:Tfp pilus assembly protein PilO
MTRRDRLVIVIVALVAAIAASWLLVVSPKRDQATKLGTKVASEQQALDTARAQLAQNAVASKQYASNYAALARLGEAVPASDDIPSLIVQLQSAADGARVNFQSLQNGGANATSGTASTPAPATGTAAAGASAAAPEQLSFTFSGSYFQLSNFFNKVQHFVTPSGNGVQVKGRLISLNSVNMTPGASGFPQITAQITATIYTESAPAEAAGAATGTSPAASTTASTSGSSSSTPAPTAAISSPVR